MADRSPESPHVHPPQELLVDLVTGVEVPSDARDHVTGCATCSEDVAELASLTELLGSLDQVSLLTPSPRVWEGVRAATTGAAGAALPFRPAVASPGPTGSDQPSRARPSRRRGRVLALVAGGVAAGLVVGAGLGAAVVRGTGDEDRSVTPVRPAEVAAARLEPLQGQDQTGSARLLRSDGRLSLHVDVPAAGPGDDPRQVWLVADDGSLTTLGLVDLSGRVDLPVPAYAVTGARSVDVSSEPADGDPAHSGTSLYRGTLRQG